MRVLGLLDNTLLIVTSDHGHSIGDGDYIGKTGYPSHPSVYDVPLFVRYPDGRGAGTRSDAIVQHTDVTAEILRFAGVRPEQPLHGRPLLDMADGRCERRDRATVGWGAATTVITRDWYMNCKIDGRGPFLYALKDGKVAGPNVADRHADVVEALYRLGVEDAAGGFPEYLKGLAARSADAPGCSALAARKN